jgi:hypothetical protein
LQNRRIIAEARGLPGIGRPPAVDAVEMIDEFKEFDADIAKIISEDLWGIM